MTSGRLLARNSALNLFGQAVPLLVAVLAIPPLVRGLGAERFGILTLAWAAIGYFSLFELGLSRALTQAVAQRLGNGGESELPEVIWTALVLLLVLGIVGAVVLMVVSPLLVTRVLNVPPELRRETIVAFWILACSLPLVVSSVGLRGVMEAHQDFGVATALRIPLSAFMFIGPLLVLPFSKSLVPAVSVVAAGRAIGWLAHFVFCLRRYPPLQNGIVLRAGAAMPLLRFGGWSTVSNVISPVMVYLDRFLIGALLPLAAVTHYATPFELVIKLTVIPLALLGVMFPAFAATFISDRERMRRLYEKSLRLVLASTFPIVLVTVTLSREALHAWVGQLLPPISSVVLQWLALGVFVNSIAQVPLIALQGAGRPDLVAKLHLFELPLYAVGIWLLARTWGLEGVAIAWTARVSIDAIALLAIARSKLGVVFSPRIGGVWPIAGMLAAFAVGSALSTTVARVVYVAIVLLVFGAASWLIFLTPAEREQLKGWMRRPIVTTEPEGLA